MTLAWILLLLQGCPLPAALQACHPQQSQWVLLLLQLCCCCCIWLPAAAAAAAVADRLLHQRPHQAAESIGLVAGQALQCCGLQALNLLLLWRRQRRQHLVLPLPTALQPRRCCLLSSHQDPAAAAAKEEALLQVVASAAHCPGYWSAQQRPLCVLLVLAPLLLPRTGMVRRRWRAACPGSSTCNLWCLLLLLAQPSA